MALGHLGVGKEIANLETERSAEAASCRRYYEEARDTVLRSFNWPFATKIEALALVEEDPNDDWGYSYQYPSGCVNLRRILSGIQPESPTDRIVYRIAQGTSGRLIFTNQLDAQVEFTVKVTAAEEFTNDFTMALSYLLASLVAPTLTKGDPFKIKAECYNFFLAFVSTAQANAVNEEQPDLAPDSEFIRARL